MVILNFFFEKKKKEFVQCDSFDYENTLFSFSLATILDEDF